MNSIITKPYQLIVFCLAWLLLTANVAPTAVRAQEGAGTVTATFAQLGYNDLRLQGLYGSSGMWVPFQTDWFITDGITFELTYVGSPLLNRDTAIVTILADGREVTSFRPVGDGREQTITIDMPPPQTSVGGVNLTFTAHLRLTDDPCEDSFNIGQWLIIRNSSRVMFNLAETAPPPQLTDLPQALIVQGGDNPPPVIFVLPQDADETTLTTAAQVASRLGEGVTTNHLPIRVKTAASLTDADKENSNLVIIGLRDNQPLIDELSAQMPIPLDSRGFVSQDNALIPDGDGVTQIFTSPWQTQRRILLVSANDSAGLAMAGRAFADRATFQSLTDSFQFINSLVERPEPALQPPWTTDRTSFAQLGEASREVTGLGIINAYYFFRYPPGVMPGGQAQLALHLAFSPALSTQQAYAEVYVNDIYVGAVQASGASGDSWVALGLPAQALNQAARAGRGREVELELSIANLLPVNNCEPINAESGWTKIYDDSYFQMNYQPVELPDLYFFPYPFVSLDSETPTRLVLPAAPTVDDLQIALSVAALLGNHAVTNLDIDVVRATAVTPEAYAGRHLILIGDNPLRSEIVAGMELDMPGDIYQIFNAPNVGFFHTLASPWDAEMTVLAIYGQTRAGLRAAAETLYTQGRLTSESGSLALVRPDKEPEVIYREVGLYQPELLQPDMILSEISQQPGAAGETTETAETGADSRPAAETIASGLTSTERIILVITAFLVILVTVVILLRMAWRIRA
jgi:hypothetical protein